MEGIIQTVQSWPLSIHVIVAALILAIIHVYLKRDRPYPGLPIAQIQLPGYKYALQWVLPHLPWMLEPETVMQRGKDISKGSDGIYQVRASAGYKIVLPRHFGKELRLTQDLTFAGSVAKDFHAAQPGFEALAEGFREDNLILDAVHKLIQNIGAVLPSIVDETNRTIVDYFGAEGDEWRSFDFHDAAASTIARIFARVTGGKELARDDDWVRVSKDYAITVFVSGTLLHQIPSMLRPLVVRTMPLFQKLHKYIAEARRILAPRIEQIEQSQQRGEKQISKEPDIFTFLVDVSKGRRIDFPLTQLNLSLAAIHTTAELLIRMMIHCSQSPDVVRELREEIVHVLKEEGGWSKSSLYKMRLLDSFMKEVSRVYPTSVAAMLRYVVHDIRLSNGVILPAGGLVMLEDDGVMDPLINPSPETFDAHRYLRMRSQPNEESRHQFATTSTDNLVFGYGVHQCPGRQLASSELKVILGVLLIKYDWRVEPGFEIAKAFAFESRVAAPHAMLQCRRREEEINLTIVQGVK